MEVLVYNQPAVIHKSVIVNSIENVRVDVSMANCDEDFAVNCQVSVSTSSPFFLLFSVLALVHLFIALAFHLFIVLLLLFFFFFMLHLDHVKPLEFHCSEAVVLILNQLIHNASSDDLDLGWDHFLDFLLDVVVFKGWRIDDWNVKKHLIVVIIELSDMALLVWDNQNNVLWPDSLCKKSLDKAVCVYRPSVYHNLVKLLSVCEKRQ